MRRKTAAGWFKSREDNLFGHLVSVSAANNSKQTRNW